MSWDVCSCTTDTQVILCFSFYDLKFYLCEWGFFSYVCVCAPCACNALKNIEEGFRSSGTATRDSFDLPCGYKELKFGPLYEQSEL